MSLAEVIRRTKRFELFYSSNQQTFVIGAMDH